MTSSTSNLKALKSSLNYIKAIHDKSQNKINEFIILKQHAEAAFNLALSDSLTRRNVSPFEALTRSIFIQDATLNLHYVNNIIQIHTQLKESCEAEYTKCQEEIKQVETEQMQEAEQNKKQKENNLLPLFPFSKMDLLEIATKCSSSPSPSPSSSPSPSPSSLELSSPFDFPFDFHFDFPSSPLPELPDLSVENIDPKKNH